MKTTLFGWLKIRGLSVSLVGSVVILLAALAYEKTTGLVPCPLCWLQRGIFMGFVGLSVLSFFSLKLGWLRYVAALAWVLVLGAGVGVALRHMYIKLNPASASCGLDIETLLDFFPLLTVLTEVLKGSADCAQAADLLFVPLPVWSLVGYVVLATTALLQLLARRKKSPSFIN